MVANRFMVNRNSLLELIGSQLDGAFREPVRADRLAYSPRSYRAFDTPTYLRRGIQISCEPMEAPK